MAKSQKIAKEYTNGCSVAFNKRYQKGSSTQLYDNGNSWTKLDCR